MMINRIPRVRSPRRHASAGARLTRRPLVVLLLLTVLVLAQGCEDDSGSGVSTPVCVGFFPAESPEPGKVVAQVGGESVCGTVAVELVATDVNDVYAVATTVRYDASLLTYVGRSSNGTILRSDGAAVNDTTGETTVAGEITVGLSRVGDVGGLSIVGTERLITLYFIPATSTARSGGLTLDSENCLQKPGTDNPVRNTDVICHGGTLTVS